MKTQLEIYFYNFQSNEKNNVPWGRLGAGSGVNKLSSTSWHIRKRWAHNSCLAIFLCITATHFWNYNPYKTMPQIQGFSKVMSKPPQKISTICGSNLVTTVQVCCKISHGKIMCHNQKKFQKHCTNHTIMYKEKRLVYCCQGPLNHSQLRHYLTSTYALPTPPRKQLPQQSSEWCED